MGGLRDARYGPGGARAVSAAIGMSRTTLRKGLGEQSAREEDPGSRLIGTPGGGRRVEVGDPIRSRDAGGSRAVGRTSMRGGDPAIAAAVDVQEHDAAWPRNRAGKAMGSSPRTVAACCARPATACKPTARPRRAAIIRIATRSSSTSISKFGRSSGGVSRSYRWTPKRRNWWGISRIRARMASQGIAEEGQLPRLS